MRGPSWWARLPRMNETFSPRANSVGFIRLVLASSVLVSHSWPLALGRRTFYGEHMGGQTDLGGLAVYGFFALSGFLITRSGLRFSLPRFAWHRFLRIYPGLWVCLLVTALVLAPLVAIHERGSTAGFWTSPGNGPLDYLRHDWWAGIRQYNISGLLTDTPYGRMSHGSGAFDGSLWSLLYELLCYVLVGVLAVTAVLKRAPRGVLALTALAYFVIVSDYLRGNGWDALPRSHGTYGPYPLIGNVDAQLLTYFGFLFLLGACLQLYQDRVPMHPVIAGIAAVAFVVTLHYGGVYVIGLPAYAYLLFYAACKLPSWLHGVGRRHDYSYGLYIYAFPVQMITAMYGVQRHGVVLFILVSACGAFTLAILSWHLVESQAMKLKDWSPWWTRRGTKSVSAAPAVDPASGRTVAIADPTPPVPRADEDSAQPADGVIVSPAR